MPLTDKQIKSLKAEAKAKKYFDGHGLYLEVAPSGGKWWRLKYRVNGAEKRISLGTYPAVSLAEARDAAHEYRKLVREGHDPSLERKRSRLTIAKLFKEVATEWFEKENKAWTPHYAESTFSRLERFLFSEIGNLPLEKLEPLDILDVCKKTAIRSSPYLGHVVLRLCDRIFQYSVLCGYVKFNPCQSLSKALPSYQHKPMSALTEPKDIQRLLKAIYAYSGHFKTICALKLMPLLMCRTGELRHAKWKEIDFDEKLWRIPGHRMKMRRDHLIPLSRQSIKILRELYEVTGHTEYLLPGRRSDNRVMSENTITAALRNMDFSQEEMCGHGFRSLASTRLNEMGVRGEVIEKQLAHEEKNKVRKVYNRAEYLDERRDMLQKWADYLDELVKS